MWESLLYVQVSPLPAFTVFIPHRHLNRCDWKWNNINQGYSSCIHPSIQPLPQSKDMHVQVKFEVDAGASVHAWLSHYLSLQSDNAWFMSTEEGWVTFSYWIWLVCVLCWTVKNEWTDQTDIQSKYTVGSLIPTLYQTCDYRSAQGNEKTQKYGKLMKMSLPSPGKWTGCREEHPA